MRSGADDFLAKPLDPLDRKICLIAAERVVMLHRSLDHKTAEVEQANRELFQTARTDPLTGVGNRLRPHEDLTRLEGQSARYQRRGGRALPGHQSDGHDVLSRADAALYRAKTAGRNRVMLDNAAPDPTSR